MYELSKLLKEIKEQREGNIHSVADLKKAVLTEMFKPGGFNWNEQADACEAMLKILEKCTCTLGTLDRNRASPTTASFTLRAT